jgi:hypothetical protein
MRLIWGQLWSEFPNALCFPTFVYVRLSVELTTGREAPG